MNSESYSPSFIGRIDNSTINWWIRLWFANIFAVKNILKSRKDSFRVDLELDDATKEYFFENIDENHKYLDKYNDIIALTKKKKDSLTEEKIKTTDLKK